MSQVLPLFIFAFVSVFVFVFGLSENIRFKGSLRPDGSVTSLLSSMNPGKLLRTGRDGREQSSSRGPCALHGDGETALLSSKIAIPASNI